MADSIDIVRRMCYDSSEEEQGMKQAKTISMSIRVNEDELQKLKTAAELLSYSSYSEFVRRTALIEANRIITDSSTKTDKRMVT